VWYKYERIVKAFLAVIPYLSLSLSSTTRKGHELQNEAWPLGSNGSKKAKNPDTMKRAAEI
jgi:hypothetical protein